jgi:protein-disulfide isomerase
MHRTVRTFFVIMACSFAIDSAPVQAATSDEIKALEEEVAAIREGQEKMQKDLDEIKKLLEQGARPAAAPSRAQAFQPTDIELGDVPYKGQPDAPVTLIEFSDYHCPYCRRHATTVMPELIKKYVETGKLRFVMREYPIPRLHPRATAASEAALCAGEQGQYWGMHDALFNDQKATSDEAFQQMAEGLGLDMAAFNDCTESDRFVEQIEADIAEGQKLGISGTPSFVVGLTDPEDSSKVSLTKFIRGAQSLPAFSAAIDELLKTRQLAKQ